MTENSKELISTSIVAITLIILFSVLRGCANDDNEYRLEKLRIEQTSGD